MTAIIGFGATLSVNDGGSGAQQVFTNPLKIQPPQHEGSTLDSSNISTANMIRTFIPGFIDPGKCMGEMEFLAADYTRLVAVINVAKTWVVTCPPGGTGAITFSFSGILTKLDMEFEADKIVSVKIEVKVSGAVTMGTAS